MWVTFRLCRLWLSLNFALTYLYYGNESKLIWVRLCSPALLCCHSPAYSYEWHYALWGDWWNSYSSENSVLIGHCQKEVSCSWSGNGLYNKHHQWERRFLIFTASHTRRLETTAGQKKYILNVMLLLQLNLTEINIFVWKWVWSIFFCNWY